MSWTRIGTVSVTNNSNAVIGTGTGFLTSSRVGDAFIGPDGALYEVTNIASDTAMSIAPNYKGPTTAVGAYSLAPIQGYVKDTADALRAASAQMADSLDGLDESVAEAAASAVTATNAKNAAAQSETNAGQAAAAALASKNAAGISETNTGQAAAAALASKNAAGTSETNAGAAAAAALASKNAAAISEQNTANKAAKGANSDITSLSALTTALSMAQGGTGVTTIASLLASLETAGAYGKTNVLGTVSQAGGVPTGALMEYGSNSNGEYWKYACGMMICRFSNVIGMTLGAAYGTAYYNSVSWTFPVAFVSGTVPYSHVTAVFTGRITMTAAVSANTNLQSSFFVVDILGTNSGNYVYQWIAIGRWF